MVGPTFQYVKVAQQYLAEKIYQRQVTKLALSDCKSLLLEVLHKLRNVNGVALIGSV